MDKKKIAIITGGSRGIGFAIAEYLNKNNYTLLLIATSENNLRAAVTKLGGKHHYAALDIADYEATGKAINKFISKVGSINLLINSAGYVKRGTSSLDPNEFTKMVNTNLIGLFNTIHSVAPHMKKQNAGKIINIASYSGVIARAPLGGYAASKFGVLGLNESLYKELSQYGISVTAICPNLVNTDMTADVLIPAEKKIPTSDIVNTVDYLLRLSDNAGVKEIVMQCVYKLQDENKQ